MYKHSDMINRIKAEKQQKGFTNAKLSELTKIPIGTLNKILSGDSQDPHVSSIIKIAQALDVSADYIILGKTRLGANNCDKGMALYKQLDEEDKAEIRGEMKQMLKAPKYSKNSKNDDYIEIAAYGGKTKTLKGFDSDEEVEKFLKSFED